MNQRQVPILILACVIMVMFFIGGCSIGKKNVLFYTKTSLGVDIDSKPPSLDIGYDRKEGTLSPRFENGEVLPQLSNFAAKVGVVNMGLGQSFATGDAAIIMAQYLGSPSIPVGSDHKIDIDKIESAIKTSKPLENNKVYFFGTDTSFGFRINFGVETGGIPDSLNFGYKRKELAYVPLFLEPTDSLITKQVSLPALLSTIGMSSDTEGFTATKVRWNQFFATGKAASYLAAWPEIRSTMGTKIIGDDLLKVWLQRKTFKKEQDIYQDNKELFNEIKNQFTRLSDQNKIKLYDKAVELGLASQKDNDESKTDINQFSPELFREGVLNPTKGQELRQLHNFMNSLQ